MNKRNCSLEPVCFPREGAAIEGNDVAWCDRNAPPACREISSIPSHDSKKITVLISSELYRKYIHPRLQ